MKLLLTLCLTIQVGFLYAQPKWAKKKPISESEKYDYFVGIGTSEKEAYLDAVQVASQYGEIEYTGSVSLLKDIINDSTRSTFSRSESLNISKRTLNLFQVDFEDEGDYYYVLIGAAKDGRSTKGGTLGRGNFIWRSSLVPGWGQFFNKEPSKGLLFSLGEVGLIGGTIFSLSQAGKQGDQARLALMQGNLAQYNSFDQSEKSWRTTGTVLGVGAIACWVLNIVDATASDKNLYVFNRPMIDFQLIAANHQLGFSLTF